MLSRLLIILLSLTAALPAYCLEVNGQLKKAQAEHLSADPTCNSTTKGRFFYDTDVDEIKYCDSASFVTLSTGALYDQGTLVSTGAGTTTLTISDHWHHVFTLSADHTVVLPTTSVPAGYKIRIETTNTIGAEDLTIQSSDADVVETIRNNGVIELIALQATPTDATHWKVTSLSEQYYLTAATFASGAGTGGSYDVTAIRQLFAGSSLVNAYFSGTAGGTGSPTSVMVGNTTLIARFRPTYSVDSAFITNLSTNRFRFVQIESNGTINFAKRLLQDAADPWIADNFSNSENLTMSMSWVIP